jgi:hypothetical protein
MSSPSPERGLSVERKEVLDETMLSTSQSSPRDPHLVVKPTRVRAAFHVPGSFLRLLYITIACFNLLLILATLLSDLGVLPRGFGQFDLKLEGNFATWYSSVLLYLAGGAALLNSLTPPPATVRPAIHRLAWTMLSLALFALSVDEMIELHERIGLWFTTQFGTIHGFTEGTHGTFAWVVALLPFVALFVAGMGAIIRTWLRAHSASRTLAAAALSCWIGVIAAEVVEAEMSRLSIDRMVEGVVEEGLEITGSALLLAAFCEFLRGRESSADQ